MARIITHNGTFHPDDTFAVAVVRLACGENLEVVRTRDMGKICEGDFVIDVGTEYDPARRRFDHHQIGGAGVRPNGVPYASFGLVWKEYGVKLCGSQIVADRIDSKLVQYIDAMDNGSGEIKPVQADALPYTVGDMFFAFRKTWKETTERDQIFLELVMLAERILKREIISHKDAYEGELIIKSLYESAADKRIIILDKNYDWGDVLRGYPEPLFVISPASENDGSWHLECVKKRRGSFENRKDLPRSWGGKHGNELEKITGVAQVTFCHNGLFFAAARSKEGAIALAKLALDN